IAAVKSPRAPRVGLAPCSSHTALVWVTVTSSSTPSAPISTPARSRPRASTPVPSAPMRALVVSSRPVRRASAVKAADPGRAGGGDGVLAEAGGAGQCGEGGGQPADEQEGHEGAQYGGRRARR